MLKISEITCKDTWEEFIRKHAPQSLFQSWNWGETISKTIKSELRTKNLWRLGLYNGRKLLEIAQVVKVIARRGTFLYIRHGPILSTYNKNDFRFFLDYLKAFGQKEKSSFLRISPLVDNSQENKEFFHSLGFRDAPIHAMDGEYCWVLDIDKNEDELLSGMRKTTRYLIRYAQKIGVKIIKSKKFKDLDDFLTLYRETANRHGFVQHKGIIEEFKQLLEDDQILLLKGYYQNKLLAAALIVFYNNQAIYHHSASIDQKIPANYLLQWDVIKEAKLRNKDIYNFWGIAPENKLRHPWKGLSLFKKGFGGRVVEYLHAQDLPLSFLYCTTYMMETLRKIRKGY